MKRLYHKEMQEFAGLESIVVDSSKFEFEMMLAVAAAAAASVVVVVVG